MPRRKHDRLGIPEPRKQARWTIVAVSARHLGAKHVQAEAEKMSLSETIRHAYPGDARVLRLLIYKRDSVMAARDFLLNLLGGFQTPVIERRRDFASVLSAIWRLPTPKI